VSVAARPDALDPLCDADLIHPVLFNSDQVSVKFTMHGGLVRKATLGAALALAGVLLLGACGNGDGSSGTTTEPTPEATTTTKAAAGQFNDADVTFAQGMIPHHRQAVEMADFAEARAQSPEVLKLAAQIKAAQDPEIQTMTGWLEQWGQDVPEDMGGMEGHEGMDSGEDMPGMMSSEDMDKLEAAKGAAFDKMFMDMMIEHHEGAIEMAKTEQSDGKYAEAKQLAETIEKAQTAEIATMRKLLAQS
jgi:uncharacterized protein (DUF305 family)